MLRDIKPAMAPSGSPSCTASPTRPKPPPPSPSATANPSNRFYLDRQRVHVGDHHPRRPLQRLANEAAAKASTRSCWPRLELVSRLNQRARNHRLAGTTPSQEIELGDGNQADVGDLIITQANDRRLRITATDWVKNGDPVKPSST